MMLFLCLFCFLSLIIVANTEKKHHLHPLKTTSPQRLHHWHGKANVASAKERSSTSMSGQGTKFSSDQTNSLSTTLLHVFRPSVFHLKDEGAHLPPSSLPCFLLFSTPSASSSFPPVFQYEPESLGTQNSFSQSSTYSLETK